MASEKERVLATLVTRTAEIIQDEYERVHFLSRAATPSPWMVVAAERIIAAWADGVRPFNSAKEQADGTEAEAVTMPNTRSLRPEQTETSRHRFDGGTVTDELSDCRKFIDGVRCGKLRGDPVHHQAEAAARADG